MAEDTRVHNSKSAELVVLVGIDITTGETRILKTAASAPGAAEQGLVTRIAGSVTTVPTAEKTDDAAFAVGTDKVTAIGFLADDTAPDSADEGDIGIPRMSLNRVQYGIVRDGQGNERGAYVDTNGNLQTVNPGTTVAGQAAFATGAGAASATTQRVAIATDANAVSQATHDNLNANANLQIGNADASDANPVPTRTAQAATSTTTQVADNATSVTLLAANANRRGAAIENSSSARCHIKFGITASTADYTVSLAQYGYYEVPFGYTGRIDAIWASDPNDGGAKCTELTA